jgi:hypothetical protein
MNLLTFHELPGEHQCWWIVEVLEGPMRWFAALAAAVIVVGCDGQPTDPCVATESKPVLDIVSVHDPATGAVGSTLSLSYITLDGIPVDSAILRTNVLRNVERTPTGIVCTLPCSFGIESGTYGFDVRAPGFYPDHAEVVAAYTEVPAGCPAAHGQPTSASVALVEADSARVKFTFAQRRATGLPSGIASVIFDDGSGARTLDVERPPESFLTRNAGTLHVRFVVGAPDTIAVGDVELALRKDWEWSVGAYLYDRSPVEESFCIEAEGFPLRRVIPGADSLYIGWAGAPLSESVGC